MTKNRKPRKIAQPSPEPVVDEQEEDKVDEEDIVEVLQEHTDLMRRHSSLTSKGIKIVIGILTGQTAFFIAVAYMMWVAMRNSAGQ